MSAKATPKIEELESIRGIAALLVVLFHMPAWYPALHGTRFLLNSFYMVDLFFVLSGFVMNLNYGNRIHNGSDLLRFQFLRLGRLYPVHLLFLLVAVLTASSSWVAATAFGLKIPSGSAFKDATLTSFTEQLLLLHSLGFFKLEHPFNLPSWSISVEFYTYLVFAVLCLISRYVLRMSAFGVLSVAALSLLAFRSDQIGNFSEILQCLAGYFLGCLVATLVAGRTWNLPRSSTFMALAAMTVFLCLRTDPTFSVIIFFLSALIIVAVVASGDGYTKRLLRHPALEFLGRVSYSIYMSHTFVIWVCNQFVRVVLRRPEAIVNEISTPQLSLWGALLWYSIAVGATILLSTWVFKYIEDPFRLKSKELAQRFMSPKRDPVRVAVAPSPE